MRLITVGLTGGIASGKSAVADLWRSQGATIIDSDDLAHRALEPGTPTYARVVETFGTEILNEDGTVDRQRLGEIVFNDKKRREELNNIVHPAVADMWQEQLAGLRAGITVVAIPLLFEVGAEQQFNTTVAVGCSEQTQLKRLEAKGLTGSQARARIQAQMPVQQKMDRSQYAIWNDGSRAVLARQAEIILSRIKES